MSDARTEGYAAAIFAVANGEGVLDQVSDELFRFARALEQDGRLREALTDLRLPPEHRAAMVVELLEGKASAHTVNLVRFMVEQGRARDLPGIAQRLTALAAEERKRAVAEVRSAVPLDGEQRAALQDAVARATGKSIDLKVIVDPSVIGGLLVRVGDVVFDGTVRRRLQVAKEHLERG